MKMKNNIFKISLSVVALVAFVITFSAAKTNPAEEFSYIGVDKCAAMCHKGESKGNQLEIWQKSKHADAYKTLITQEADDIAKGKGFNTPAAETPECVQCHTLGKSFTGLNFDDTFDKTQGVQCETCHGPGSDYKKMNVMKDRQLSIQNGMTHYEGADLENFCKSCHNEDSPTFKGFNFEESWAKIKHPKP